MISDGDMEKKLENMNKITLSEEEKGTLWQRIWRAIITMPAEERGAHNELPRRFGFGAFFSWRQHMTGAIVGALITMSVFGGTAAYADRAKPGDFFFPVDLAVENVRFAVAGANKKPDLRVSFAAERVTEVESVLKKFKSVNKIALDASAQKEVVEKNTKTLATFSSPSTTTAVSSTSTPNAPRTNISIKTTDLEQAKKTLDFALEYLRKQKADLEAEGNSTAVATINMAIAHLTDLAANHIAELDRVEVKISDTSNASKQEIKIVSEDLKTTFKLKNGEGVKDGQVSIAFNVTSGEDEKNNKSGKDNRNNDNDRDDKHEDKKTTICYRGKNITIANQALWAHIKKGGKIGKCYEAPKDEVAPIIKNIETKPAVHEAKVSWNTNERAVGTLWYGTSSPVHISGADEALKIVVNNFDDDHTVTINNLSANTTYYFIISARDKSGNTTTSSQMSFKTLTAPVGDTSAPIISDIDVDAERTSAHVDWDTNENTTGAVWYGTTTPVVINKKTLRVRDNTSDDDHNVTLQSLSAGTIYYFLISARDSAGNSATSSTHNFITLSALDTAAPSISNLSSENITVTTAEVSFATNEGATSKLWYGTSASVNTGGTPQKTIGTATTTHSFNLTGLVGSTTYYFVVSARDAAGNTATSSTEHFTTLTPPDTTAPVISSIATTNIATTTATISWNTNENATSKLWYGTTTTVNTSDAPQLSINSGTMSYVFNLTGLTGTTTYYAIGSVRDTAGNTATTTGISFTTTN